MSRALVTGGAGFIGSHLVELLLKKKYHVTVIDNLSNGRISNIKSFLDNRFFEFIECDIRDDNICDLKADFEFIFHLAGMADIVPSIEDPKTYYNVNVSGTLNILEFAKKNKKLQKFLYAASSSCYGLPSHFPTNESEKISPQYPYALTKYLGEELVMHWGACFKLPVISLRLFNVYGPRSRTTGTYGAVFGVFLAQKFHNKPFTVVGDGSQTRDFTYVSDVANAFLMSAESGVKNDFFNIGSENHYSINYLVSLLGGNVEYIPRRPGEPNCTYADITKIKKLIGWSPTIDLKTGVNEMLQNISAWSEAPIWDKLSIEQATESWFKYLGDNNA